VEKEATSTASGRLEVGGRREEGGRLEVGGGRWEDGVRTAGDGNNQCFRTAGGKPIFVRRGMERATLV